MQSETRTAVLVGSMGVLAWLGWIAAQHQWSARGRAERTALAYTRAVSQLDTAALERISFSGSAHNSLCAGRWSLSRAWGREANLEVVRRHSWRDTLEYHISRDTGRVPSSDTFVVRIALARPDKVVGFNVPPLRDSATAVAFYRCTGWVDWPRLRQGPPIGH